MRCPSCNSDNPDGKPFCGDCGAALPLGCPKCGALNPQGKRFCGDCGVALTSPGARPSPAAGKAKAAVSLGAQPLDADALPLDGERKTVTVLFADIKGSMELIEDLDPEAARAIVDPALKIMMEAVHRYDGYVAQSTGDGIFALFGAPVAHEDHPQRALYAALRMQEEIRRYSDRLRAEGRQPMQVRVGANTGEVVMRSVSTGEHAEYVPVGHATSLAARMQVLAPIGSIAITSATQKLVEGYFALKALGPTRVKGVSEPVDVFEVTGLGPLRTRLQRSASRGYTKFVGRQREMEAMRAAAEQARAGHGQIVAAMAEAGTGKSRLFFEFKAVSQSGWMVLETFSVSHGKASAYLPVIDLLHNYFRVVGEDDARTRREKLIGKVLGLDRALEDTLPYLYGLLGIAEQDDALAGMDAQIRKRRTLDAIKRLLLRESLNQPLIVIFEDLHWIDEETQALLNLLADSIGTAKILMLVNYRPEYSHSWGSKTYYTQLRLDPLGKESADEMLSALLGPSVPLARSVAGEGKPGEKPGAGEGADLSALKRLIIEKTEGNPFFMEETVQVLLDEGALVRNGTVKLTRPLAELKIPPTVQAILAARIDRLAPEQKDLLQTLAVIGTEFPLRLIREVLHLHPPDAASGGLSRKTAGEASEHRSAPLARSVAGEGQGEGSADLERMLTNLQLAEFIYEQPAVGDVEYIFKHALTHDVAYHSILNERRRQLHERIGAALESIYAESLDDHVAELAHHYARSGNPGKAVEYCLRAVQLFSFRGSNVEALVQCESGLEQLEHLPDDDRRAELELDIRNAAFGALGDSKGYASLEAQQSIARAMELCQRPEINWKKTWWALFGIFFVQQLRPDVRKAEVIAAELIARAEEHGSVGHLAEAENWLAYAKMVSGDFELAAQGFDRGWALLESIADPATDPTRQREARAIDRALGTQQNNRILSGWNSWFLGYPDRALERMNIATAIAYSGTKTIQADIHGFSSYICELRREAEQMRARAEARLALATAAGFFTGRALSEIYLGWADAMAGDLDGGITRMRHHMSELKAAGSEYISDRCLAFIATSLGRMRRCDEGLRMIDESFQFIERTGQRYYEAELHRLKGELLLAQDSSNAVRAEKSFRTAIEVARKQHAKSWELRATTSLARLLNKQGKRDEARAMLAEIHGWFTEGFDTADLKDAKALLDELSG